MLKDRRILIEQELTKALSKAAEMYLNNITSNGNVHSEEYLLIKDRISNLQFDLVIANDMIDKGHE